MTDTIERMMARTFLEVFTSATGTTPRHDRAHLLGPTSDGPTTTGVTVGQTHGAKAIALQANLVIPIHRARPTRQTLGLGYLAFQLVKPGSDSPQVSGSIVAICRDGVIVELYTVLTRPTAMTSKGAITADVSS